MNKIILEVEENIPLGWGEGGGGGAGCLLVKEERNLVLGNASLTKVLKPSIGIVSLEYNNIILKEKSKNLNNIL